MHGAKIFMSKMLDVKWLTWLSCLWISPRARGAQRWWRLQSSAPRADPRIYCRLRRGGETRARLQLTEGGAHCPHSQLKTPLPALWPWTGGRYDGMCVNSRAPLDFSDSSKSLDVWSTRIYFGWLTRIFKPQAANQSDLHILYCSAVVAESHPQYILWVQSARDLQTSAVSVEVIPMCVSKISCESLTDFNKTLRQ